MVPFPGAADLTEALTQRDQNRTPLTLCRCFLPALKTSAPLPFVWAAHLKTTAGLSGAATETPGQETPENHCSISDSSKVSLQLVEKATLLVYRFTLGSLNAARELFRAQVRVKNM